MKIKEELTEEMLQIMERFDFDKCHAYMVLKDWKWNSEIPTETQLREWALTMMEQVIDLYIGDEDLHSVWNYEKGLFASINTDGDLKLLFFIEAKASYTT